MSEKKIKYFTKSGHVPEGKDGNMIWKEKHPKGFGSVWYNKPVKGDSLSGDVENKQK